MNTKTPTRRCLIMFSLNQDLIEALSDGTLFGFSLKHLLELEHELKQKYNEEGVK